MRRPPRRRAAAFTVVALAVSLVCGCFPNRRDAATAVEEALRRSAGVASSEVSYTSDFENGAEADFDVALTDAAVPDQAAAVGTTFTDLMAEKDFAAFRTRLRVSAPRRVPVPGTSVAQISFAQNAPYRSYSPVVGDSLREWLSIAGSPGVRGVGLTSTPGVDQYEQHSGFHIEVSPQASDADLLRLAGTYPDLDRASWELTTAAGPLTPAYTPPVIRTYTLTGLFPDDALRRTWNAITAAIGDSASVSAETDLLADARVRPATAVTVIPEGGPDRDQNLARARSVLPDFARLPQPVRVSLNGAVVTLGGCTAPDPVRPTPVTPEERELRAMYEKCPP